MSQVEIMRSHVTREKVHEVTCHKRDCVRDADALADSVGNTGVAACAHAAESAAAATRAQDCAVECELGLLSGTGRVAKGHVEHKVVRDGGWQGEGGVGEEEGGVDEYCDGCGVLVGEDVVVKRGVCGVGCGHDAVEVTAASAIGDERGQGGEGAAAGAHWLPLSPMLRKSEPRARPASCEWGEEGG